jgi:hypothetical protein
MLEDCPVAISKAPGTTTNGTSTHLLAPCLPQLNQRVLHTAAALPEVPKCFCCPFCSICCLYQSP